ncbi:MAG: glucokinase [Desulfobacterales bacterium]|jgi:glucokinase
METQNAPPADPPGCLIAGDVGGTKTMIGLFKPTAGRAEPLCLETFSSREARGLEAIIEQVLAKHPCPVTAACFGIAGPVIDGEAATTNLPWVVSEKRLQEHFGWSRVRLINDLSATAMTLPFLSPAELAPLNAAPLQGGANMALVAPGTGLGQALLIHDRGQYVPVSSEGGHADFAPNDALEVDLWRVLRRQFGHVSGERLLSGQGLVNIYEGLKSLGRHSETAQTRAAMQDRDPAWAITEAALRKDDPLSRETLARFCRICGAVAGNLALTGLATGGVFLGGGIPPKILPLLKSSEFMIAFVDKGRLGDFLAKIGVRVILNDKAALLGAARAGMQMLPDRTD